MTISENQPVLDGTDLVDLSGYLPCHKCGTPYSMIWYCHVSLRPHLYCGECQVAHHEVGGAPRVCVGCERNTTGSGPLCDWCNSLCGACMAQPVEAVLTWAGPDASLDLCFLCRESDDASVLAG